MTVHGRRALVTAGSSGLGTAIATSLRADGAEVFITGTGPHTGEVAREIGAAGWAIADFTRAGAAAAAADVARETLGGIDILVSNTGGTRAAKATELCAEDWDSAYRLLLDSAISLTNAVLPAMSAAGWGRLIYVTSVGVVKPLPLLHLSNVMRAGVAALARSLAAEVAPHGVTTHVIAPAHIDTPRRRALATARAAAAGVPVAELEQRQLATELPVGRWGRPEEIGELVAYLCSEFAGFQTGQTHVVDGGMTST
ncbi:SDR family oxidoreductase [Amycolatopsis acidiphila]|uniref:SDR family oxidoreductase n=1 Tax=Amycolatopsis acidiphila TaxID=715473 RepID=A0A558AIH2_9PSEU|nr:SDR family oxidoreductase [Amycolatopsis acidiphila]TVT24066.1 SDR family oxidoreductase [Amycolatopsis acidiphila]UIJ57785.1 SDR family oxidoreductase [Amycolatopsis acidiphila]GHG87686.1 short-chain dehydrogenase/reductase [Amycolatopsis acidiphila]